MNDNCGFCNYDKEYLLEETELSIAMSFPTVMKPGHFVVASKKHCSLFQMLEEEQIQDMLCLAQKVSKTIMRFLGCEKFYIASICDDGTHFHIHFIPKMADEPKLGKYLFTDYGWRGELHSTTTVQDIQAFIKLYQCEKQKNLCL